MKGRCLNLLTTEPNKIKRSEELSKTSRKNSDTITIKQNAAENNSCRIQAPRAGLEPATPRLTAACSTIELSRHLYNQFLKVLRAESSKKRCRSTFSFIPSKLNKRRAHLTTELVASSRPVSSVFRLSHLNLRISNRPISTRQLHTLPYFHLAPIHLVVFKGSCDVSS